MTELKWKEAIIKVLEDENETSENILNNAGDNNLLASQSGVIQLDGDSLGIYTVKDSLISNEVYKVYIYAPGSPEAKFNIIFRTYHTRKKRSSH